MKKIYKYIVILEIVMVLMVLLLGKKVNYEKHIFDGNTFQNTENTVCTEGVNLKPGVYNISVLYDGWDKGKTAWITALDEESIGTDAVVLNNAKGKTEYTFWVVKDAKDVKCNVDSLTGEEGFRVKEIHIETSKQTYLRNAVVLSAVFVLLNLIVLLCIKIRLNGAKKYAVWGILAVITLIVSFITLEQKYVNTDLPFHIYRIEGLAKGLMQKQFPVKIQPLWMNNYGYATSVFYGDLLLYFPAILRVIGFSSVFSFNCFVVLVNVLTVVLSYISFYKITERKELGVLGAVLISFSQYRLLDLNYRGAVGEFQAFAFVPLVIYGIYKILVSDTEDKGFKNYYLIAALGFTGLLQSHLLSTLMTGIFVSVVCLVNYSKTFYVKRFVELFKTVMTTVLLNFWFILPMFDFMRDKYCVNDGSRDQNLIQAYGINIKNIFDLNFSVTGDIVPAKIGASMVLVIVGFLIYKIINRKNTEKIKGLILSFCLGMLAIFMSTNLFPYDKLRNISILNSFIVTIQFPWRFLVIAISLLTFTACGMLAEVREKVSHKVYVSLIYGVALVALLGGMQYYKVGKAEFFDDVKYYDAAGMDSFKIIGAEYVPSGTDVSYLTNKYVYNLDGNVYVRDYHIDGGIIITECENGTDNEGLITVPLLYYRGYRAQDMQTKQEFAITKDDNNSLQVVIPAGFNGKIMVRFHEFWYWRVAELISLCALVFLTVKKEEMKN